MKSKLMICPKAKAGKCINTNVICIARLPHLQGPHCDKEMFGCPKCVPCRKKGIPYRPKRKPRMVRVKAWVSFDFRYGHYHPSAYLTKVDVCSAPCHIELKKSDYDKLRRK